MAVTDRVIGHLTDLADLTDQTDQTGQIDLSVRRVAGSIPGSLGHRSPANLCTDLLAGAHARGGSPASNVNQFGYYG